MQQAQSVKTTNRATEIFGDQLDGLGRPGPVL